MGSPFSLESMHITESGLLVPGREIPKLPPKFEDTLRVFDPLLFVSWEPERGAKEPLGRFCIWQKAPTAENQNGKSYVWLLQNPDGSYMEPSYKVIEKLAEIDLRRKGYGPEDADKFMRDMRRRFDEMKQRLDEQAKEAIVLNSKDNKFQLRKAKMLIDRHSMKVNQ